MFSKVLIANRGAIAVRIEKTLKKMNIKSVAIYTRADQDSLHVDMADEAFCLGDGTVSETYLNEDKIIEIAKTSGAGAIHPGYGFLSENSAFARKCNDNGIVFIGPKPEQMELFGLKHSAREIARRAGVPMLEGTGLLESVEEALDEAEEMGYPVILKSTAGGGGIGMRVCRNAEELSAAYTSCKHLAEANFSNAGVFLEKYLEKARHIEVQIFGNEYGEVVALAERDCSVQRRNQKVMEECPAVGISDEKRNEIKEAARRLACEVGYKSAGTVEFLYDTQSGGFYFLEVNTRLQVEHGVTEEVLGIDLVEWMIKEAAGELRGLDRLFGEYRAFSIQCRIYAEDGLRNFIPSAGRLDYVEFPADVCSFGNIADGDGIRVETWIQKGTTVSSNYDPMLAKLIVKAATRDEAISKMMKALKATKIYGVTTNIDYLCSFMDTEPYRKGDLFTHILDGFTYREKKLEVIDGGIHTSVQDANGRLGYWDIGVPPSAAMDSFSFKLGNRILGNDENAAGIEFTLRGGSYKFRDDCTICITGADMQARLDDEIIPMYEPVEAACGQILTLDRTVSGMRTYLLVSGGFDIPEYLGSKSTFALGGFGGHGGRVLRTGDLIGYSEGKNTAHVIDKSKLPCFGSEWEIGVIPGPHCTTEFLKEEYLKQLTDTTWEIHFNSDRTGVRLIGPTPLWAREDGGEAGLHPSNLHDNAYAVGTIDLTGDMPIILGPDGPSLGGFVCPVTIPSGELWKIGQLAPGNKVRFKLISIKTAENIRKEVDGFLENVSADRELTPLSTLKEEDLDCNYPLMQVLDKNRSDKMVIRCAGDEYVLVEYGEMEIEMRLRIRVHALMELVKADTTIPLIDTTPGIRSLQVHIDSKKMSIVDLAQRLVELDGKIGDLSTFKIKSRKVKIPVSWNDAGARLAMERYYQNVRPDAPWCPDNIEFIRRINGLDSIESVKKLLFSAEYIILGLGDVYLGAPVGIPLDPRHRLVTTKYNPARTWTPENAIGIGGAYLGIYGMEGPGGYQLFGRTIQTWNPVRATKSFPEGKPWLYNFFDQISFYEVTGDELLKIREDFLRGRFELDFEDTVFDYGEYLRYEESLADEGADFKARRQAAFDAEKRMWKEKGLDHFISKHDEGKPAEMQLPEGTLPVTSNMPGSVWKIMVNKGDKVKKGDTILIEESMKMEFPQTAPSDGTIVDIFVKETDEVCGGQLLAAIR